MAASANNALTMINLCNISYDPIARIPGNVNTYNPNLRVVWGPVEYTPPGAYETASLIYIVKGNIVSQSNSEYTVVIRGTNMYSWDSWADEDFDTGVQVGFNTLVAAAPANAKIARGTQTGMLYLIRNSRNSMGVSPQDFLKGLGHSVQYLNVTGHSLGGTLVPPYLTYICNYLLPEVRLPLNNCQPFSFAGLTPGNAAFNTYFQRHFTPGIQWRYVNPLDVAPNCWWSKRNIEQIYVPYEGWDPLFYYGLVEMGLFDTLFYNLPAPPNNYVQPSGEYQLPAAFKYSAEVFTWILEAMYQHHSTTYVKLLTPGYAAQNQLAKKPAKKTAAKKTTKPAGKKTASKKVAVKKVVTKKTAAKKTVKKVTPAKPAKKVVAKKTTKPAVKKSPAKKVVKRAAGKAAPKKTAKRPAVKKIVKKAAPKKVTRSVKKGAVKKKTSAKKR